MSNGYIRIMLAVGTVLLGAILAWNIWMIAVGGTPTDNASRLERVEKRVVYLTCLAFTEDPERGDAEVIQQCRDLADCPDC